MRKITIEIPEATPLLNKWQRMHYQERKRVAERFGWLVRQAYRHEGDPIEHCMIHVERHSAGLPDWDGLHGGLKPILDCLVVRTKTNPHGQGIIVDDNPNVIKKLTAEPVKAKRGEGKTILHITELEIPAALS